jgi:TetR/AcrR family transcriptional repressor of nem operon
MFRHQGIAATGLVELMAAVGLTRGGFYKHFDSKEQLVAEASAHAVEGVAARLGSAVEQGRGTPLQRTLDAYLTVQHRDHPEGGCLFAALGPELARGSAEVRAAAAVGLERMLDVFQQDMARADAVVALAASVGALTLARLAPDTAAAEAILQQVRSHLLEHLPSGHANI